MRAKSLQDLEAMRTHLEKQQKLAREHEAARKEAERKASAERNLFARAAGKVEPLKATGKVTHPVVLPEPIPVQRQLDDQRVLREAISDEFDAGTLLDVDDTLRSASRTGRRYAGTAPGRRSSSALARTPGGNDPKNGSSRERLTLSSSTS